MKSVCVAARHVFVFQCAFTTSRFNVFPTYLRDQKKSEFYGPNFQTFLFLVTTVKLRKIKKELIEKEVLTLL